MKKLLKYIYLRLKFRNSFISYSSNVSTDSYLAEGVKILSNAKIGSCQISAFSYIGVDCIFERTRVGSFSSIGPQVVCGLGSHPIKFVSTYPGFYSRSASGAIWFGNEENFVDKQEVTVGSDVWIGARSLILGGINIGHGAVIGAGSIVTKDVPPYAIAVGVPAKIIKYRFDDLLVGKLLESKWWELPKETLVKLSPDMSDPAKFLTKLSSYQ